MSGTPAVALASPAPLMYTAENPQRSIKRAMAALNAPGITTQPLAIARRNRVVFLTLFIELFSSVAMTQKKETPLLAVTYPPTSFPGNTHVTTIDPTRAGRNEGCLAE